MKENKEKMLELLKRGLSYRAVGEVFGVSKQRVHEICGKSPVEIGWGGMSKKEIKALVSATRLNAAQNKRADKMVKESVKSLNKEASKSKSLKS